MSQRDELNKLRRIDTIDNDNERIYVYEQTIHTVDKNGNDVIKKYTVKRRYQRVHNREKKMENARQMLTNLVKQTLGNPTTATALYKQYVKECIAQNMEQNDIVSYSVAAGLIRNILSGLTTESMEPAPTESATTEEKEEEREEEKQ